MKRDELVTYLNEYLRIGEIKDYGPQGLQVEGRPDVNVIVGAVDAHQPTVEAAVRAGADLLLVHHGILWGPARLLSGHYGRLVRTFMTADLNLYAAHLPLDGHPEVGNNAELARRLGLEVIGEWAPFNGFKIGVIAHAPEGVKFEGLVDRYTQSVSLPVLVQPFGPRMSRSVAILSGAGAGELEAAVALGCDTVVTGETSHAHFYDAQDLGINVLYGGHYGSETVGVQALGAHLAARFSIEFKFIDLPTGI